MVMQARYHGVVLLALVVEQRLLQCACTSPRIGAIGSVARRDAAGPRGIVSERPARRERCQPSTSDLERLFRAAR